MEKGQSRATEIVRGMGAKGVGSIQPERRFQGGLPIPEESYMKTGKGHFIKVCGDNTKDNGFKLEQNRFRLDTTTGC